MFSGVLTPMNVNDADTKHFFDNRYGTGQLIVLSAPLIFCWLVKQSSSLVMGWCGKALHRARGMGANVIVTKSIQSGRLKQ